MPWLAIKQALISISNKNVACQLVEQQQNKHRNELHHGAEVCGCGVAGCGYRRIHSYDFRCYGYTHKPELQNGSVTMKLTEL